MYFSTQLKMVRRVSTRFDVFDLPMIPLRRFLDGLIKVEEWGRLLPLHKSSSEQESLSVGLGW